MIFSENKSNPGEDVSILIKFSNHAFNYLCDCGEASNLTVSECKNIKAIFITHTHMDHFIDFDKIIRSQLGIKQQVIVCGPKNIAQNVRAKLKSYTWNLVMRNSLSYQVREVLENNMIQCYELYPPDWELKKVSSNKDKYVYQNDIFKVKYTILDHATPTVAYLFVENNHLKISEFPYLPGHWISELKEAYLNEETEKTIYIDGKKYPAYELFKYLYYEPGDSLGIIMDHKVSENNHNKIIDLFKSIRKLYIECYYLNEDKNLADLNNHSTAIESAKVARMAEVKNAVPIHFSKRYRSQIDELIEEFTEEFQKKST